MRVLVALSGGMDSSSLVAKLIAEGRVVEAVGLHYGSKHNKYEQAAAAAIASHYNIPFDSLDISPVFQLTRSNLLKTGGDIPEGHYEAETMRQTVVPGRNLIIASILASIAESRATTTHLPSMQVHLGVHAGDHHIYPDCRPEFVDALDRTVLRSTEGRVSIHAPYTYLTKVEILAEGVKNHVPYRLTRTCYKDQPIACGKCGSCQERLAAFAANYMEDPLEYESRELLPA